MRWETRQSDGGVPAGRGTLRVVVHSDVSGRPLGVAGDTTGTGRDTVYFTEDPRPSFPAVEAEVFECTLAVEEPIEATFGSRPAR